MSLAIECGATHSVAVFMPEDNGQVKKFSFGAANFKLMKENNLETFIGEIKKTSIKYKVKRLAVAMAGILNDNDRKIMQRVIKKVWPNLDQVWIGNDLESALACIDETTFPMKCIVISGTGSCCYGVYGEIKEKVGGWGHIIGDIGSGYAIAHTALRRALKDYERNHSNDERESHEDKSVLLNVIMSQLNMTSLVELTGWSLCATKAEIADLAPLILKKSKDGNIVAQEVVNEAVEELANDVFCLIKKLSKGKQVDNKSIQIGFTGSMLCRNEHFSNALAARIMKQLKDATIVTLKDTVYGGLNLLNKDRKIENGDVANKVTNKDPRDMTNEALKDFVLPIATALPLTELRNPRSMNLDKMPISDAIDLMISEDEQMFKEIAKNKAQIELLVEKISDAFKTGGRLFYTGAGTSGRLGVLDASECIPTFKSPPHWVQGIIAGGDRALRHSIEGAEDVIADGISSILDKDVNEHDIVIGIAACGRTPFTWGSLYGAKLRHAFTALITMNSNLKLTLEPDVVICVNVGPEVLTGSTRLKSGTATKCVLNMITTLSMVRYGKCMENLMIDVNPTNAKLRDRCLRIVMTIVDDKRASEEQVENTLIKFNYDIRKTVEEIRKVIKLTNGST